MSLASLIDELNPQQKQAATTEAKAQFGFGWGRLWQDQNYRGACSLSD